MSLKPLLPMVADIFILGRCRQNLIISALLFSGIESLEMVTEGLTEIEAKQGEASKVRQVHWMIFRALEVY
jgi:hypothetical protein